MPVLKVYNTDTGQYESIVLGTRGPKGDKGDQGDAAVMAFDAGGDANAARPAVAATTIVFWYNVPSEPTNLGQFDVWEDVS
ncbi:MAG: hypothetical protein LC650_00915 [Actinobacteria bacterium]|nr:hypothetical protein [Actinomycetota bacterium]